MICLNSRARENMKKQTIENGTNDAGFFYLKKKGMLFQEFYCYTCNHHFYYFVSQVARFFLKRRFLSDCFGVQLT